VTVGGPPVMPGVAPEHDRERVLGGMIADAPGDDADDDVREVPIRYVAYVQEPGLGARIFRIVADAVGWRGLWLTVTGTFLMLAGVALRQTTTGFFTGQAQPVISSFTTAVVDLQPAGFTLAVQNFLPGSVQVSTGSLTNQGRADNSGQGTTTVPVNLFMTVVAEMSSPLDSDATGGIHVAIFRCRNDQNAPVPCGEARRLIPIPSYMGATVTTEIPTSVGMPVGVTVSGRNLVFPGISPAPAVTIAGVPVLTVQNNATETVCERTLGEGGCYLGSFGPAGIETPATTLPYGSHSLSLPAVPTARATGLGGNLEYLAIYTFLPGAAPALMQGQSSTLTFVFSVIQVPGGLDVVR